MKYIESNCSIELSVRELCARAFLSGDLDKRPHSSLDAMRVGAEIHKKIQNEAGATYSPEVQLVNTFSYDGIYYTVSGRADGVIRTADGFIIDEIKSVRGFDFLAPPRDIFVAQMKCYAYFLACREELGTIGGRISYVNSENGKIKYFNYRYSFEELRLWYRDVISRISTTAKFIKHRQEELLPVARNAVFPYGELREGQELMIREWYGSIKRGERFFACAPTGIGKTMSALYPAVRALGADMADKIFYLTAKSSTRREAYRAAGMIFEAGTHLRTVVLSAKEQVCLCAARISGKSGDICNGRECEFARGYYDRAQQAVFELLSRQGGFTRRIINEVALKYRVCPYELSLDLSEYCDIIICDYNYVFDPTVYLRRYFGEMGERGRYLFLVDEAHNLPDRARDMYSATLRRSQFERIYAHIDPEQKDIDLVFERMIMALRASRRLCKDNLVKTEHGEERGFYMNSSLPEGIMSELENFRQECDKWLRKNKESHLAPEIENLLSEVRRYLTVCEYFDERFLFYIEISGGDTLFKVYCLDPSYIMDVLQNRAVATALFSATLAPMDYFTDVLGGGDKANAISLPSPFDTDNLCVAVAGYLSTRYEDRKKNINRYVSAIAASICARAGNYIVYFPSYEVLRDVSAAFVKKYPDVKIIAQRRDMSAKEREEFIDSFKEDTGKLRIGFCVLGGSFGEGIDLPGSRLIGTVIFGVGLPGLSNEKNIIKEHFDTRDNCGYDYAYTFPGMNNVLQAAGRVIRREEDRGIVVLVDDRYTEEKYRTLFPEHWKNIKYATNASFLAESVKNFWEKV